MKTAVLNELVKFTDLGHTKTIFYESERIKAQIMGLEAGQQIPPCRMDHDVIFVVMEGKGKIVVDGPRGSYKGILFYLRPQRE
ncbi:MAG: hypothetical protein QHH14_13385 [Clostridiales bacterium]|nr:hypothetical protein [Clostridiales bacterium]